MPDFREQTGRPAAGLLGQALLAVRESTQVDLSGGVDGNTVMLQVDQSGQLKVNATGFTTAIQQGNPNASNANAWPNKLTDGANVISLQQFHAQDNLALGTFYGIGAGGITQVLNVNGNLDRARGCSGDALPGTGLPITCSMTCQTGTPVGSLRAFGPGRNVAIPVSSAASFQVGQVIQVDTLASGLAEWSRINAIIPAGIAFSGSDGSGGPFLVVDALVNFHPGTGGTGVTPIFPVLFNMPRDAAGEADQSAGVGASMAVGYVFDGVQYQRERSACGLNLYADTLVSSTTAGNLTVLTTTGTPPALPVGSPVLLNADTPANAELCQVVSVVGRSIMLLSTAFNHAAGSQIAAPYQGLTQAPVNFGGWGLVAEAGAVFSGIGSTSKLPQYSVEKDINAAGLTPTFNTASAAGMDADASYGIFLTTPPALGNNQLSPLQMDAAANLKIAPQATSGGGAGKSKLRNLAATVTSIKASAGTLWGIVIVNNTAATAFVQLFDAATGSVTLGTTTPDSEFQVPPNGSLVPQLPSVGVAFGTAISAASTTLEGGSVGSATGVQVMAQFT